MATLPTEELGVEAGEDLVAVAAQAADAGDAHLQAAALGAQTSWIAAMLLR